MTVHDIRGARRPKKRSRLPWTSRLATSALGICFALSGVAIASLSIAGFSRSVADGLLALGIGASMALFGTSMSVQSLRGEPTVRGFFMRGLSSIAPRLSPASVLLALLGLGLASIAFGFALQRKGEVDAGTSIILGWLAFHVQILFHEYGHWFAGRACGYGPYRVVGGALSLSLRGQRWYWHTNQDWRFLIGGAVFVVAPHERRWSHDFSFVAAGPLATALLCFVCMEVGPWTAGVPILSTFVGLNAAFGILALVTNLIPFRYGDMSSDGLQLLQLISQRPSR